VIVNRKEVNTGYHRRNIYQIDRGKYGGGSQHHTRKGKNKKTCYYCGKTRHFKKVCDIEKKFTRLEGG
jgi:hypothetical protein